MSALNIPPHEIMEAMSKLALEAAMSQIARQAETFAASPTVTQMNGRDALLAFAAAMRDTNAKVWPTEGMLA
jgi:hypothetical protein